MPVEIDEGWTVNEVTARYPGAIAALEALGLDTCCGGWEALAEAAASAGVDMGAVIAAIRDATARDPRSGT